MRLHRDIVFAINTYFAHKRYGPCGPLREGESSGMFKNGEEKKACLSLLDKACTKHGVDLCVAPGLICLSKRKQSARISSPILPKAAQ